MSANKQPIGIFDSGIGGLTVAKAIAEQLPNESLIYFGDTLHLPYGDKSTEAIKHYSQTIAWFLAEKNCKAIVIACNTASASSFDLLKKMYGNKLPIVSVIDPLIDYVVEQNYSSVGVLATPRTVELATYHDKLKAKQPNLKVKSVAAKSLASIIEEGFQHNEELIQSIIQYYFSKENFPNLDSLILGCTHYPVIHQKIQEFRKDLEVIDAPLIIAKHLKSQLQALNLLSNELSAKHCFYVSDYTNNFEASAKTFFGESIELQYCPLFQN
ncbi:UNVERIFIED_CONTAM: hypothetical protein GTU68_028930 [Idotea baltica]|nr:hypothetical protein [Idotea baltica]